MILSVVQAEARLLSLIDDFLRDRLPFDRFWLRYDDVYIDETPEEMPVGHRAFFGDVQDQASMVNDRGPHEPTLISVQEFRDWLRSKRDDYLRQRSTT